MTSFLTLNAGLVDVRLFGLSVFTPVPYVTERLRALPDALRETGADVVCLQEVYFERQKTYLADALADLYPNHAGLEDGNRGLGSGLMVLSRYAVRPARLVRFQANTPEERLFSKRAVLEAVVELPEMGQCRVLNFHATAGGLLAHPESDGAEACRRRQIDEMLRVAGESDDPVTLIIGDLNAGPTVSSANYRQLLDGGYASAFAEDAVASLARVDGVVSWDPDNFLNVHGTHRNLPPQLVDHIFLKRSSSSPFRVVAARIVLDQPRVDVPGGDAVTVSDHYGVLAHIGAESG